MAPIRSYSLENRTQRLKLPVRGRVYVVRLSPGIRLGYRRTLTAGTWSALAEGTIRRFALADDHEDSNGTTVLTFFEAQRAGLMLARRGLDNVGTVATVDLEQQIIQKAKRFLDQKIEPACYLYRHYDPSGDLLYVGVSLEPLRRQSKHFDAAAWRHMICKIVIEPFETRDAALAAEQVAIRDEFPIFNRVHSGRRHPIQELSRRNAFGACP
jgi:hypothetical protein